MKYSKKDFLISTILFIIVGYYTLFAPTDITNIPTILLQVLWLYLLFKIWAAIIPNMNKESTSGKLFKKFYDELSDYSLKKLLLHIRKANFRALITFVFWIVLISIVGLLRFTNVINDLHIYLLVAFFNFFDYFSINVWCPFHKIFIKDKCCNTCRIYNWDHFLKYSPFIFIINFWTYSLLLSGVIALIQWEIMYILHPERFTEISNQTLKCTQCEYDCRFNITKKNKTQK